MLLKTDRQTTDDLAIFGKRREGSVYGLFNKTATAGGARVLEEMFLYPLSDTSEILKRAEAIKFFSSEFSGFPFSGATLDSIEYYLSDCDARSRLSAHEDNLERKIRSALGTNTRYEQINKGVVNTLRFLFQLKEFQHQLTEKEFEKVTGYSLQQIKENIVDAEEEVLKRAWKSRRISYKQTVKYDQLFRFSAREKLLALIREVYTLDVLTAVGQAGKERNFTFAIPVEENGNILEITEGFHPLLDNAIPNTLKVSRNNNMIFLTGANMAGKSTFMKMVGISVYLAHMGFPVPAKKMKFAVLNGMYTTINLADNINMGYSHFYAEVMRVKRVSESVGTYGNMLVIFDELFRGTNVKDAYDATVAVSEALAGIKRSVFIISSHIIEAGEKLMELRNNISFLNLPTIMDGNIPRYTYKIEQGISSDRHGMLIIRNEGIPQMLMEEAKSTN